MLQEAGRVKKAAQHIGVAATITAIFYGITKLSPSLRDLWDVPSLLGLFLIVQFCVSGVMWMRSRLSPASRKDTVK